MPFGDRSASVGRKVKRKPRPKPVSSTAPHNRRSAPSVFGPLDQGPALHTQQKAQHAKTRKAANRVAKSTGRGSGLPRYPTLAHYTPAQREEIIRGTRRAARRSGLDYTGLRRTGDRETRRALNKLAGAERTQADAALGANALLANTPAPYSRKGWHNVVAALSVVDRARVGRQARQQGLGLHDFSSVAQHHSPLGTAAKIVTPPTRAEQVVAEWRREHGDDELGPGDLFKGVGKAVVGVGDTLLENIDQALHPGATVAQAKPVFGGATPIDPEVASRHKSAEGLKKDLQSGALNVLDKAMRPINAIDTAAMYGIKGKNVLKGFGRGITGKEHTLGSDVLKELGAPKVVAAVGGFISDVALDPTTYLTLGVSSAAREAAEIAARQVTREAMRGIEESLKSGALKHGTPEYRAVVDATRRKALEAAQRAAAEHDARTGVMIGLRGRPVAAARRLLGKRESRTGLGGRRPAYIPHPFGRGAHNFRGAKKFGLAGGKDRALERTAGIEQRRLRFEEAKRQGTNFRAARAQAHALAENHARQLEKIRLKTGLKPGDLKFDKAFAAWEKGIKGDTPDKVWELMGELGKRLETWRNFMVDSGLEVGDVRNYADHPVPEITADPLGAAQALKNARAEEQNTLREAIRPSTEDLTPDLERRVVDLRADEKHWRGLQKDAARLAREAWQRGDMDAAESLAHQAAAAGKKARSIKEQWQREARPVATARGEIKGERREAGRAVPPAAKQTGRAEGRDVAERQATAREQRSADKATRAKARTKAKALHRKADELSAKLNTALEGGPTRLDLDKLEKRAAEARAAAHAAAPHMEVSAKVFNKHFAKALEAKQGKYLTEYSEADRATHRAVTMYEGKAGFAVAPDGEIVSVYNLAPYRGLLPEMLERARAMGGTHLWAFDDNLGKAYRRADYEPSGERYPFDPAQQPKGWDVATDGEPDFVRFEYSPKHGVDDAAEAGAGARGSRAEREADARAGAESRGLERDGGSGARGDSGAERVGPESGVQAAREAELAARTRLANLEEQARRAKALEAKALRTRSAQLYERLPELRKKRREAEKNLERERLLHRQQTREAAAAAAHNAIEKPVHYLPRYPRHLMESRTAPRAGATGTDPMTSELAHREHKGLIGDHPNAEDIFTGDPVLIGAHYFRNAANAGTIRQALDTFVRTHGTRLTNIDDASVDLGGLEGKTARVYFRRTKSGALRELFPEGTNISERALRAALARGEVHVIDRLEFNEFKNQLRRGRPARIPTTTEFSEDTIAHKFKRTMQDAGRHYDHYFQGPMKFLQTAVNLGYHATNMIGDILNSRLGGTRGSDIYRHIAPMMIGGGGAKVARDIRRGRAGQEMTGIEGRTRYYAGLGREATDREVIEMAMERGGAGMGIAAFELPELRSGARFKAQPIRSGIMHASERREDIARVATFQRAMRDGMTPDEAASWANKHLIDYSDLSPFEVGVIKRVIPFYTFAKKNAVIQARGILQKPGQIAAIEKAREESAIAAGMDPKFVENLPLYSQNGLPFAIPYGDKLLKKLGVDTKGMPLIVYPKLPSSDLAWVGKIGESIINIDPSAFGLEAYNQLFQRATPFIKVPLEAASGYNFFFRAEMDSRVPAPAGSEHFPFIDYFVTKEFDKEEGKKIPMWPSWMDAMFRVIPAANLTTSALTPAKTVHAADPVLAWMGYFLGPRPALYDETDAERKQLWTEWHKITKTLHDHPPDPNYKKAHQGHVRPGSPAAKMHKRAGVILRRIYKLDQQMGSKSPNGQPPRKPRSSSGGATTTFKGPSGGSLDWGS